MSGVTWNLATEFINDKSNVLVWNAFNCLLDDMVSVLIGNALHHAVFKFLDHGGLLLDEDVLKCLRLG